MNNADISALRYAGKVEWEFNANWKMVGDNGENYHHVYVHGGVFAKMSDDIDMETFRLEVGETHGAGKGNIVGALANEAGIEPRHMGKIRLFQYFSLIELPSGMPKEIFQSLKNIHVRGRRLDISKDKGRPNHAGGSKSRPYKKFGSKPGGKFHGTPNGKFGPKSSRSRKGTRN